MLLIFEGPDGSGKSTISKAISARTGLPYFKNPQEHAQKESDQTWLVTKYAGSYFANFIQVVEVDAIIDRHYPSEFVYAQVEGRLIDLRALEYIDERFASAKGQVMIIVCMKRSYEGFTDAHGHSSQFKYPKLVEKYHEFMQWSHVKYKTILDTSGQNLSQQCEYIMNLINDPEGTIKYETLNDYTRTR